MWLHQLCTPRSSALAKVQNANYWSSRNTLRISLPRMHLKKESKLYNKIYRQLNLKVSLSGLHKIASNIYLFKNFQQVWSTMNILQELALTNANVWKHALSSQTFANISYRLFKIFKNVLFRLKLFAWKRDLCSWGIWRFQMLISCMKNSLSMALQWWWWSKAGDYDSWIPLGVLLCFCANCLSKIKRKQRKDNKDTTYFTESICLPTYLLLFVCRLPSLQLFTLHDVQISQNPDSQIII